jgi:hypothetical protein
MIHGMNVPHKPKLATLSIFVGAFAAIGIVGRLTAETGSRGSLKSPAMVLRVRLYIVPNLSSWALISAEKEAAQMLSGLKIPLDWLNCTAKAAHGSCLSPESQDEVVVRIVPKALAEAPRTSLGMACREKDSKGAFIFYDRVEALRGEERQIPIILGRVLAHEIAHLLIPMQPHSEMGLMRERWYADDLRANSTACLGLSPLLIKLMQKEIARRTPKIGAARQQAAR